MARVKDTTLEVGLRWNDLMALREDAGKAPETLDMKIHFLTSILSPHLGGDFHEISGLNAPQMRWRD